MNAPARLCAHRHFSAAPFRQQKKHLIVLLTLVCNLVAVLFVAKNYRIANITKEVLDNSSFQKKSSPRSAKEHLKPQQAQQPPGAAGELLPKISTLLSVDFDDEDDEPSSSSFSSSSQRKKRIKQEVLHPPRPSSSSCRRKCHKRINKIYYADRAAGLNDRKTMIHHMAELAGYLCAELILPPPSALLHRRHNFDKTVSKSLKWSDFYNVSFVNDDDGDNGGNDHSSLLLAVREGSFNESRHGFNYGYENNNDNYNRIKIDNDVGLHIVSTHAKVREDFAKIQQFTWNKQQSHHDSNTKFVWEIYDQFFDFDLWQQDIPIPIISTPPPIDSKGALQQVQLFQPEMLPYLPDYKNHIISGCRYTNNATNPSHLNMMRKRLRARIDRKALSNSIYGQFHIRRGDTVDQCDTSVDRIRKYLNCSLSGTELRGRNFTLLFTSDETDVGYRRRILDQADMYPHVTILDADEIANQVTNEAARNGLIDKGLQNNFYVFEIQNMLRDTAWGDKGEEKMTTFHMVFRRTRCHDCIPLDKWLSNKKELANY